MGIRAKQKFKTYFQANPTSQLDLLDPTPAGNNRKNLIKTPKTIHENPKHVLSTENNEEKPKPIKEHPKRCENTENTQLNDKRKTFLKNSRTLPMSQNC